MAKETGYLWRCEYPNCRHTWMVQTEDPPRRCAKCRKCNWHKTITLQETIRLTNWRQQMMDDAKPYISEQIKVGIAQAILDAKKRKGEYVAEANPVSAPNMAHATVGLCIHSQPDYETNFMAHCGKMAGHKHNHGAWIQGAPLDP